MPNRQRKYVNIETPQRNCTKQTRRYGTTTYKEFHPDSAWKRLSKTYMKLTSTECTVQKKTPDDGQRKYTKHVEFYNRINLDN